MEMLHWSEITIKLSSAGVITIIICQTARADNMLFLYNAEGTNQVSAPA
jgi:hypothetical protein